MADSSRYRYSGGRRSPPLYNPARASMPVTSSAGYSSFYPGDIHVQPPRHELRAVPVTTTTYAVRKDPTPSRTTSLREPSRTRRSSTIDSTTKRPIIVTTRHAPPTSGSAASSGARSGSPSRESYRPLDEGAYYAQPASSISRARSTTRTPYSATLDDDELRRLRERTGDERLHASRVGESYRPRPAPLYNNVRHQYAPVDYGDEGYEFMKPSDLARYDLDNDRVHHHHQRGRRESLDRYYRPSVSVTTDLNRVYDSNDRRVRGPPPTTWGLDKINTRPAVNVYDDPGIRMPIPPLGPEPSRRPAHLDVPRSPSTERRGSSRTRPLSLIQDNQGRTHHEDYYRPRDDDLRDHRDRDFFHDDNVASRGFGLRVEPAREDEEDPRRSSDIRHRDERRSRRDHDEREPRRRSDEEVFEPVKKRDHDDRDRRPSRETRLEDDYVIVPDHKGKGKEEEDDRESKKDNKIRDKLAAGISIAGAAIGLGGAAMKDKDEKEDREDRSSPRRRRDDDDKDYKRSGEEKSPSPREDFEVVEAPRERQHLRKEPPQEIKVDSKDRLESGSPSGSGSKQNRDSAAAGSSRDHSSSTDEGRAPIRRRRRGSNAFNPNDTSSLMALKAQMAGTTEGKGKEKENDSTPLPIPIIKEPSPARKPSPDAVEKDISVVSTKDIEKEAEHSDTSTRGRELIVPAPDEKQVRVVSPPRDKDEKKPIKGILKQPKESFPEEPNPIREGVAPHKDDKTKTNVPSGARWTKINRKMVNPEALLLGKERFETRDGFVIVLRVLSKEEIQMYAAVTAELRERRRKEYEKEKNGGHRDHHDDADGNEDEDADEPRRHHHRRHDHRERERDEVDGDRERRDRERDRGDRERERDRDREREREKERERHRHRYEDEDLDYEVRDGGSHNHHRSSHRDRERERDDSD